MAVLEKIKKDLEFNRELVDLIDVLKGIASSQFQMIKKRRERFRLFIDSFDGFFRIVDLSRPHHAFTTAGAGKMGIIMITSDEGFMGGLNAQVINSALNYRKNNSAELIILGQKGAFYLKELGEKFTSFPGIGGEIDYQMVLKLRDYIISRKLNGEIGKTVLFYPQLLSFAYREIKMANIFPCTELFERRKDVIDGNKKVILESSLDKIIEYLVNTWITHRLYEIFEDSKLSEFTARIVSLEEKHQQLFKRSKTLKTRYFYALHRLIDRNIEEVFAAALLKRNKTRTK